MTGSLGRELAPQQRHAADDARHREPGDEARIEPVVALAVLEHVLQRTDAHREQARCPM